jgi:pyruvate dehydrogenase E2 component (dihydrolipoamide acetyltransferase)
MPIEVILPKLSTTMDEGTIVQWLKKEGEHVESGETLFELETDKAVMDVESPATGVLSRILYPAGSTVAIAEVVAFIVTPGEEEGAAAAVATAAETEEQLGEGVALSPSRQPQKTAKASPRARRLAQDQGIELAAIEGSGPGGRIVERDIRAAMAQTSQGPASETQRVSASPAARRLAKELGLDLSTVKGTGPGGRIVLEDVRDASTAPRPDVSQAGVTPTSAAPPSGDVVPLRGVRRIIAERMASSAHTAACVTLTTEADATILVEWRARIKKQQTMDPVPSYTDMVILMVAHALWEHRYMNAQLKDDAIHILETVNIGVAVDTERGLLVPVLRNADNKSLGGIAFETQQLTEKTRQGQAAPEDLTGGTLMPLHPSSTCQNARSWAWGASLPSQHCTKVRSPSGT